MRRQPLLEIGMNDTLTDVIRKVNTNFKLIKQNSSNERADVDIDIEAAIADFVATMNQLVIDFNQALSGYCPLDSNGLVSPEHLPGYVDDVIECTINPEAAPYSSSWLLDASTSEAIVPETGCVYVVIIQDGSSIYRWSGSQYVQVSAVIDDYDQLSNKPSIEGVTLIGNKDFNELGIFMTDQQGYSIPDDYTITSSEINSLWSLAVPVGG